MKQVFFFRLTIFLSLILLSSCAVHKYDYYYSVMDFSNKNAEKCNYQNNSKVHTMYCVDSIITYTIDKQIIEDTISVALDFRGNDICFYLKNPKTIWVDLKQTKIIINDSINYIPFSESNDKRKISLIYTSDSYGGSHVNKQYQDLYCLSIKDLYLDSVYEQYPDDRYKSTRYQIEGKKRTKKLPCISFTEDDTPLHVKAEIAYYTDTAENARTIEIELFQSDLYAKKNQRYKNDKILPAYKSGEEVIYSMADLSFYRRIETGKTWGMTELAEGTLFSGCMLAGVALFPVTLVLFICGVIPVID